MNLSFTAIRAKAGRCLSGQYHLLRAHALGRAENSDSSRLAIDCSGRGQATATFRRRRATNPMPPPPISINAQDAGSGTVGVTVAAN